MSYTQFGYSTYATSSPFVVGTGPSSTPQGSSSTSSSASYERSCGTPDVTAVAATTYDARLLSSRLAAVSTGLYGGSTGGYPTAGAPVVDQTVTASPYPSLEPASPFYPALNTAYAMKESADPWRSIPQSAPYYYDPTLAAYGYSGLDFNGARRKNVTRDSTSTLKAWLNEHRKNPYPTKGEKIMLAIITKMTLTQVSTWFANARRRLKKENKMTWEPRNKSESQPEDEGKKDSLAEEEEDEEEDEDDMEHGSARDKQTEGFDRSATNVKFPGNDLNSRNPSGVLERGSDFSTTLDSHRNEAVFSHHPLQHHHHQRDPNRPIRAPCQIARPHHHASNFDATTEGGRCSAVSSSPELTSIHSVDNHHHHHRGYASDPVRHDLLSSLDDATSQKPKIWSLADTATNKAVQNSLFGTYQHQANTSVTQTVSDWTGTVPTNDALLGPSCYGGGSFTNFAPTGPAQIQSPGSNYGYGHPHSGFVSLQTDTPPQTPPNMKVPSGTLQQVSSGTSSSLPPPTLASSHQPPITLAAVPTSPSSSSTSVCNLPNTSTSPVTSSMGYGESQEQQIPNAVYLGPTHQQTGICDATAHHFDDTQDKQCDSFAPNSLGHLSSQSTLMSPRTSQCVRDDYTAHLQFREPSVH